MGHNNELLEFIRENRSNEGNFEKLRSRLEQEISDNKHSENYVAALVEIKEKSVPEYQTAKEAKGGTAWPEFEKFSSGFEKAVLSHNK